MAMDATILGELMKANIDALSDDAKKDRSQVFKALADAVITHIQTAAQISGIVVASVAGVTPGGGVSGPGTAIAPPGSIT